MSTTFTKLPRLNKPKFKTNTPTTPLINKDNSNLKFQSISKTGLQQNNNKKQSMAIKTSMPAPSPLINAKRIRTTETPVAMRRATKSVITAVKPIPSLTLETKKSFDFAKPGQMTFKSRSTFASSIQKTNDRASVNPFSVIKSKQTSNFRRPLTAGENVDPTYQDYADSIDIICQSKKSLIRVNESLDDFIAKFDDLIEALPK